VQSAEVEVKQLELDQLELEELRQQLARYFCEDVSTFRLDDCIMTINTFIQRFITAVDVRIIYRSYCQASDVENCVTAGGGGVTTRTTEVEWSLTAAEMTLTIERSRRRRFNVIKRYFSLIKSVITECTLYVTMSLSIRLPGDDYQQPTMTSSLLATVGHLLSILVTLTFDL